MEITNHTLWVKEANEIYNILKMDVEKSFEILWKLKYDIVHCFHRGDPKFQKYFVPVNSYCVKKLVDCTDSELTFLYNTIEKKWRDRLNSKFIAEHGHEKYEW